MKSNWWVCQVSSDRGYVSYRIPDGRWFSINGVPHSMILSIYECQSAPRSVCLTWLQFRKSSHRETDCYRYNTGWTIHGSCEQTSVFFIFYIPHHQSDSLAGWEQPPPKGPSEGPPAARDASASSHTTKWAAVLFFVNSSDSRHARFSMITVTFYPSLLLTLCGWDLAQFSRRAKTPSLHSMIQCSSMGKDSNLVAAMAIPKPISRTRPPLRGKYKQVEIPKGIFWWRLFKIKAYIFKIIT